MRQVIDIVRKVTGHPIPVVVKDAARRAIRPGSSPARTRSPANSAGGPSIARLQPIIESAWAWHQKHPNGYGD